MYLIRTLEPFIRRISGEFPALLLTGARQVGKTTLLRQAAGKDRKYVSLDDPFNLDQARRNPAAFMQRFPPPVLFDEIQYAPQLLTYIKLAIDRDRRPGMFWLTGSQQFQMMKGVTESLAGRVGIVALLGLSRLEMLGRGEDVKPFLPTPDDVKQCADSRRPVSSIELYECIWRGSFPALFQGVDLEQGTFLSSYVQTYLQRDVRDLSQVGDELAFLRFLRAAAARTGQILNLSELARDADVSPPTAKRWLSILVASNQVFLLEQFHHNVTKRMVKAPKLYFLDTGLAAYLTEWSGAAALEAGAMAGPIFETWVMGELLKSYWHNGRRAPFYYYRDRDRKEIDLLIVRDGTIFPLEIKKSAAPRKEDVRHFSLLEKMKMPLGPGGVICLAEETAPLTAACNVIPVAAL